MEQLYGSSGLREVYFVKLLHTFFPMEEALGKYSKNIWVIVNPNYSMPFMSDIINEEIE